MMRLISLDWLMESLNFEEDLVGILFASQAFHVLTLAIQIMFFTRSATCSAIANEAVRPGEPMPKRLMRPGTP